MNYGFGVRPPENADHLDPEAGKALGECGHTADDEPCEQCCDHAELDNTVCADCGADRTEDLAAQAYDRAKDARKYGGIP